jgi:hypothetical protein
VWELNNETWAGIVADAMRDPSKWISALLLAEDGARRTAAAICDD